MPEQIDQHSATDNLKELLHRLPEEKTPPYLKQRIMRQIEKKPSSLFRQITRLFTKPRTFTLHPVRLAGAMTALGLAFWMGLTLNFQNHPVPQGNESIHNISAMEPDSDIREIFLQGRRLLVSGQRKQALPYLQEAGRLVPDNPEYAYYEGLAYQATNNLQLERASYQRGLAHASDALPLLLNLGHNFLESGELDAALSQYEAVLTLNPRESAALYNKGLIYKEKGEQNEERKAWKQYLAHHRSGKWAWRAVSHLNNLGDFSYRSYQLGRRRIVLSHQALLGGNTSEDDRDREIRTIALLLLEDPNLDLNIVTFHEEDRESAKSQARELKNLLLAAAGNTVQSRIKLSWFGEAETITANTNPYHLSKGILIFGNEEMGTTKEKQI